jgi:hypothetical protein
MNRFVLVAGFMFVVPANAADYPYSGAYSFGPPVSAGQTQTLAQARNNCASSFFIQKRDGTVLNYVLNGPDFEKTGKPSYDVTLEASCRFDEKSQSEFCQQKRSIYSTEGSDGFATLYLSIAKDKIEFRTFGTPADIQTYLQDKTTDIGTSFIAYACPFSEEQIAPFLKEGLTTLEVPQVESATVLEPTPENTLLMERVLKVIAGQ